MVKYWSIVTENNERSLDLKPVVVLINFLHPYASVVSMDFLRLGPVDIMEPVKICDSNLNAIVIRCLW